MTWLPFRAGDMLPMKSRKPRRRRVDESETPRRHQPPPRDHWSPRRLVAAFLEWCATQGLVGSWDARSLKIRLDEFADTRGVQTIERWEFERELAWHGIAHAYRQMQPYESGYRVALAQSEGADPRVLLFVLPRKFPIAAQRAARVTAQNPGSERQLNLFITTAGTEGSESAWDVGEGQQNAGC